MSMFPGAGAQVYRNEVGEPTGWDYPSDPNEDPGDPYDDYDYDYVEDVDPTPHSPPMAEDAHLEMAYEDRFEPDGGWDTGWD